MDRTDVPCKSLVDWTQGRLLPAPRKGRPGQRETFYPVCCPQCHSIRWLTKQAAQKAETEQRVCKRCQTVVAGKLGYAATAAAFGDNFALRFVLHRQLDNPSPYEVIIVGWLTELGIPYETQIPFSAIDPAGKVHNFLLDAEIITVNARIAVETNGWAHRHYRTDRDRWLAALYPGEVVFISTDDIRDHPDEVKATLRQIGAGQP